MKKRILTVLIAIITVIPLVFISPKAASYSTHSNTTVTSYGQYYYSSGYNEELISYAFGVEISFPISNSSYFSFTYELKDVYNGYVSLSITAPTAFAWNTTYFYCEGCTFTQSPNMTNVGRTKTFQLQFRDSNRIQFTVIHDTSSTTTADTTFYNYTSSAFTSCSITSSNFVLQPDTPDIVDHIDNQLDIYLPGMSTSLSNIDSDLDNISQNIQALSPYIDQLEGYVDGLEGLLTSINNMQTYNVPEYKYLAYYQFSRFSYLNNDFHRGNGGYIYDMGPFVKVNSIPTTYVGEYSLAVNANNRDLYVIYYSSYWSPAFNLIDRDGNLIAWTDSYTVYSNDGYILYYQHYHHTGSGWLALNILPISNVNGNDLFPVFIGYHIPSEVADLYNFEIDNTYTRLLQSINNGIGALNDDYDTSTYDNYEQTLDGLNDGLRGRFDNVDDTMQNNVNTLFTPSGTAGSDGSIFEKFNFNGVNNLFTGVLNGIFTSFPAFKYILLFALLLLVIGVMV